VARDVTARREADDAKQAFVATVSHELRTPLTPLKGFLLTLMRPGIGLDQAQIDAIHGRMLSQAERLERLIEDLLSVSQIERGLFPVSAVPVDLTDLVSSVVSGFAGDARVEAPTRHLSVLADPIRLEQVLTNLLGNAAKYAGAHSPVAIVVEEGDTEVTVSVIDQGPGIPSDQHEMIFERFRRLGNHMTQTAGGAGLGLFIARHLVTEMGGRIWVEGEPGRGAAFRFTVPSLGAMAPARDLDLAHSLSVA
jgi:signal transduction histidine kinase